MGHSVGKGERKACRRITRGTGGGAAPTSYPARVWSSAARKADMSLRTGPEAKSRRWAIGFGRAVSGGSTRRVSSEIGTRLLKPGHV